jgi:hypothetical protein
MLDADMAVSRSLADSLAQPEQGQVCLALSLLKAGPR